MSRRVVLAPDSFKGTASAAEAAEALAWLSRVPAPSIDEIGGGVDAAGDAVDGRAG